MTKTNPQSTIRNPHLNKLDRPRSLIVIPARYGSTRFPGKPLALIAGISLVERVYRLCKKVRQVGDVIVATDDIRIKRHVQEFGGQVVMTRPDHPSGTDRIAQVARSIRCDIVINVQGDEPLLQPKAIHNLVLAMKRDRSIQMATLCHPVDNPKCFHDSNVVKVVLDRENNALYFSRSLIPHFRERRPSRVECRSVLRHIGIYAYRRKFLLEYVRWPQSSLEKIEQLEQLRALEHGVKIRVFHTSYKPIGVDVPADVQKVEKILEIIS